LFHTFFPAGTQSFDEIFKMLEEERLIGGFSHGGVANYNPEY
jgi:hypothetical protein